MLVKSGKNIDFLPGDLMSYRLNFILIIPSPRQPLKTCNHAEGAGIFSVTVHQYCSRLCLYCDTHCCPLVREVTALSQLIGMCKKFLAEQLCILCSWKIYGKMMQHVQYCSDQKLSKIKNKGTSFSDAFLFGQN